ncbi:hypothetical protein GCM10023170_028870 [Phytohabitans houttuyneae]
MHAGAAWLAPPALSGTRAEADAGATVTTANTATIPVAMRLRGADQIPMWTLQPVHLAPRSCEKE